MSVGDEELNSKKIDSRSVTFRGGTYLYTVTKGKTKTGTGQDVDPQKAFDQAMADLEGSGKAGTKKK